MKSLVFSQKVRADGTRFLKIEDGVNEQVNEDGEIAEEAVNEDVRVDSLETLIVQKLKGAATKLAFTDLASHPLDVGARISVTVSRDYDSEELDVVLKRYSQGEVAGESRRFGENEDFPLVNRTTCEGKSDAEHSVIGSLNIFGRAPEDEQVLEGYDILELENGRVTIEVDVSDAREVVGGFGTPSVLAAWATLQLFRESLEAHTGEELVPEEDYDYNEGEDDWNAEYQEEIDF